MTGSYRGNPVTLSRSFWEQTMIRLAATFVLVFAVAAPAQYVSSDTFTRYELLAPDSHQFKIYYEVTEVRAGARFHFNVIREGSEVSDESVLDLATGKPLKFEIVSGAAAKAEVPEESFNPAGKYIKVFLAHPVPARGEYRLAIVKTYKDDKSYFRDGGSVVFKRSLSIPRDSVVLPAGYEVVSCSVAAQVLPESDGRLKLAFINAGSGGALEVTINARPRPAGTKTDAARQAAASNPLLSERAYQDREILYELQAPESHAFRIAHDYTARQPGEAYYFNVVRAGSHVSDPESIDLDSGENLKWEILSGKQVRERDLPLTEPAQDDSEVVVTHLSRPVAPGTTNRIRLKETYADSKSLYLDGRELVWDRAFGRPRNMVVLPPGWYLTALGTPATIQTFPDGRVSVYVLNPRNDDIRVYLRARRRQ